MTLTPLELAHADDARDLSTFLQRANRLGCEHVALSVVPAEGSGAMSTLVASVGVLTKQGLLDTAPNVIGLRVFEASPASWQGSTVVETAAVLDRLARGGSGFSLPVPQPGVAWAGTSAPQTQWQPAGLMSEDALRAVARAGIAAVAEANGLGVRIVEQVRQSTWNAPLATLESGHIVPSGAAFAALGLGFIDDVAATSPAHAPTELPAEITATAGYPAETTADERFMRVSVHGRWLRLSNDRGHVLVR